MDTQCFHPSYRSADWRWRLSDGEPVKPLLFAGWVLFEKQLHWLLPIMEALLKALLAIVRDGAARPLPRRSR